MMKRKTLLALAAVVAVAAALVAASMSAAAPAGAASFTLYAGKTTPVGTVYVWNDATNLHVEIDMNSGWCMTESHVAAATTPAGIPQNSQQNPTPGQFAEGDPYSPCETGGDTFQFALSELDSTPVIAVHAKVWDEGSLTHSSAVSDTTSDTVYGPTTSYYALAHAAWGSSVPAVEPTFAGAGVWPTISGAKWISTAAVTEAARDSWRWHRTTLTVPAGSWPVSGDVSQATSDNAERVWHNGVVIGSDGEVEGAFVDNLEWGTIQSYSFTPVVGANTLDFVWRNYGVPGLGTTDNPNGLIYKAHASYYTHSESAWAGTAVGQTQFNSSKSWATYFGYPVVDWADSNGDWVHYNIGGLDRKAKFSFGTTGGDFWYDDTTGSNAYHVTLTQGVFSANTALCLRNS
jgi:hypothetical protein